MERPRDIEWCASPPPEQPSETINEYARYILWLEERHELLDTVTRGLLSHAASLDDLHDRTKLDQFLIVVDTLRFLDGVQEEPEDDCLLAVGYRTEDGRLYSGCPGLEVAPGWETVFVKREKT